MTDASAGDLRSVEGDDRVVQELAQRVQEELRAEVGAVLPEHVKRYADLDPELFAWYRDFRSKILATGAIARKDKMLMVLALLTATKQGSAMEMYCTIALDEGATAEEILEAARVGVLFSGGPGIASAAEISHLLEGGKR